MVIKNSINARELLKKIDLDKFMSFLLIFSFHFLHIKQSCPLVPTRFQAVPSKNSILPAEIGWTTPASNLGNNIVRKYFGYQHTNLQFSLSP